VVGASRIVRRYGETKNYEFLIVHVFGVAYQFLVHTPTQQGGPKRAASMCERRVESGQYAGPEDLAAANGVDCTFVGRILRLTSLAPGIVERILTGEEPLGIGLRRLQKDLPVVWEEQRWG
jgi:hypothetical protein